MKSWIRGALVGAVLSAWLMAVLIFISGKNFPLKTKEDILRLFWGFTPLTVVIAIFAGISQLTEKVINQEHVN